MKELGHRRRSTYYNNNLKSSLLTRHSHLHLPMLSVYTDCKQYRSSSPKSMWLTRRRMLLAHRCRSTYHNSILRNRWLNRHPHLPKWSAYIDYMRYRNNIPYHTEELFGRALCTRQKTCRQQEYREQYLFF